MTAAAAPEAEARTVMRRARSAALATLMTGADAHPYVSLVTVATDVDARPILLLSDLADHTRNLQADARASLLFENASGRANPQTGPRITVLGRIGRDDDPRLRRRFLARHPTAELYAGFADFRLYAMAVERAHFVGGFARAQWIEGRDVLLDAAASAGIAACEASAIDHMNADHVDVVRLYASRLLGRSGDDWRLAAIDPEGCDLMAGHHHARLDFEKPVADASSLRAALMELAAAARGRLVR
ncbi:MAG: DUF2470 domain-containing protein [Rhodospirillales bacterium]|nr:DUF2470 domain-containing protein [Rhodospirillales bacterium]